MSVVFGLGRDNDIDIEQIFALSNGYKTSAESLGIKGTIGTPEYKRCIDNVYKTGKKYGAVNRITSTGKKTRWVIPTEGWWPTVAEMRLIYVRNVPDTRWMMNQLDVSLYF